MDFLEKQELVLVEEGTIKGHHLGMKIFVVADVESAVGLPSLSACEVESFSNGNRSQSWNNVAVS